MNHAKLANLVRSTGSMRREHLESLVGSEWVQMGLNAGSIEKDGSFVVVGRNYRSAEKMNITQEDVGMIAMDGRELLYEVIKVADGFVYTTMPGIPGTMSIFKTDGTFRRDGVKSVLDLYKWFDLPEGDEDEEC